MGLEPEAPVKAPKPKPPAKSSARGRGVASVDRYSTTYTSIAHFPADALVGFLSDFSEHEVGRARGWPCVESCVCVCYFWQLRRGICASGCRA